MHLACCTSRQRGRRGNHRAAERNAQCRRHDRRHGAQLHLRWRLVRRHAGKPLNQFGRSSAVCPVIAPNGRLQRALATAADAAATLPSALAVAAAALSARAARAPAARAPAACAPAARAPADVLDSSSRRWPYSPHPGAPQPRGTPLLPVPPPSEDDGLDGAFTRRPRLQRRRGGISRSDGQADAS